MNCLPFQSTWVHPQFLLVFLLLNHQFSVHCFVDRCLSCWTFSFYHCVVCPSIYEFWSPLWYLQTLLNWLCTLLSLNVPDGGYSIPYACQCITMKLERTLWQGVNGYGATFNNISVTLWRPVLLVKEIGVHGENHRPVANHWQTLSHNVVWSTPRHERDSDSQR